MRLPTLCLALVLMGTLSTFAHAQTLSTDAVCTNPPDKEQYNIGTADNMYVTVTGTPVWAKLTGGQPNAQVSVYWQMWCKIDSGIRLDQDDPGQAQQVTLDSTGNWAHYAHDASPGNLSGGHIVWPGQHYAEVFSKCVFGTQTNQTDDLHSFTIINQTSP